MAVTGRCEFPGCLRMAKERHHVTYDPPQIVKLCRQHHGQISTRNANFAKAHGRTHKKGQRAVLSTEERLLIHADWWPS